MDILNIPGAYLHIETDEDVIMVIEVLLSKLIVKLYSNIYRIYVTINSKVNPLLYMKMHKYLYVLLIITFIFYKKLVSDIEVYGFTINPYDTCVANMDINIFQMNSI